MAEKKQCKTCPRITDKIIEPQGICYWCHKASYPKCQYPGCHKQCDHKIDLLCQPHFELYLKDGFTPELQQEFKRKFAEKGLFYKIVKHGHTSK